MVLMSLGGCGQETHKPKNVAVESPAITLWYGGPIITMDKDQPRVDAVVSTSGGEILFVGSLVEARE